jgi:rubrerythrin
MWRNFEEVTAFAVEKEAGAVALYEEASRMTVRAEARKMFEELAAEERRHREILEGLNKKNVSGYTPKDVPDMKIGDYLTEVEFSPDMNYRDILVLAMKREEKSKRLYAELANRTDDPEIKKLFEALAQEEAKHKLALETEYDEHILTEN